MGKGLTKSSVSCLLCFYVSARLDRSLLFELRIFAIVTKAIKILVVIVVIFLRRAC